MTRTTCRRHYIGERRSVSRTDVTHHHDWLKAVEEHNIYLLLFKSSLAMVESESHTSDLASRVLDDITNTPPSRMHLVQDSGTELDRQLSNKEMQNPIQKQAASATLNQKSRRAANGYMPIEDYGLIGNMRTCAMVATDGGLDYMCWCVHVPLQHHTRLTRKASFRFPVCVLSHPRQGQRWSLFHQPDHARPFNY